MPKPKPVKKPAKTATPKPAAAKKKKQPKVPPEVQKALQVTWVLKGAIKNVEISYIRVCKLLAQVREQKYWEVLKHPDIESYAEERCRLKRSALYQYLQVYDWMAKSHPAWLGPHPKGFIPQLNDATDLMWIDAELKHTDLTPEKKAALEALQKKGLDGTLKKTDLTKYRRKTSPTDAGIQEVLSKLRVIRRRAAQLTTMPTEVITDMDLTIAALEKAVAAS